MGRNKKQRFVSIFLLVTAFAVAAGITLYYVQMLNEPQQIKGGTLVYERCIVSPNRQKS